MMLVRKELVSLIVVVSCFRMLRFIESKPKLPQEEVEAIEEIATTAGARYWEFDGNPCETQKVGVALEYSSMSKNSIGCDCSFNNNTVCHVVRIVLRGYNLPGVLPPELVKLPYLKEVDFAYNYLKGMIPLEWASMQLTSVSVLVNRLWGQIPKELGNITSLTYLSLEANQFSGAVPAELGNLVNLNTLILSSNRLTGNLPLTFARLRNLTDLINDNNFSGVVPEFIQNWKQLQRLELHASGLAGPIPSSISLLDNLVQLRISDIKGPSQSFPGLENMTKLQKLILRSCSISGKIPAYIWSMDELILLDVSFNKLVGEIPPAITGIKLKIIFLTGNLLSGDVPDSILREGGSIDLSYNNFTWQGPKHPACRPNMNLHVNLFRSSKVNDALKGVLPCSENNNLQCSKYSNCFHVNCGGLDANIKENNRYVLYEGDGEIEGGAAKYYRSTKRSWGLSSTGDFMDDDNYQNTRYTASLPSSNLTELETTARISPLSLTYFYYCLENGKYNVTLQFAEIMFKNDSLGRRLFDTYVQGKIVLEDFDIEEAAGGVLKSAIKEVRDVSVTTNVLEVRFHWTGKGTTRIPRSGVYGPMISAISVVHESKVCSSGERDGKNWTAYIVAGTATALVALLIVFVLGVLWWKGFLGGRRRKYPDGPDVMTSTFTLKQIMDATNDFDYALKIGEGGFGPVYKGELPDGKVIAVKQLSEKSRQGNREFLNEIGMISCVQHPNLVKLHGCCIEGHQLMLVYEYMENNNLARALFGTRNGDCKLDWPSRLKIGIGVAKGLAFLHEESTLKIVHRDIKATNVLLDKNLNPKISDFGLAKLYDGDEKTHVSTRIAGTIGYMAPEYALWGHLSYKADVYSFGVLALEIVSGKNNNDYMPSENFVCLLDKAYNLQRIGRLMEIVDEEVKPEINLEEAEVMVKVALLCTNVLPSVRPTMSEVVSMLEGRASVPDTVPDPVSSNEEDVRFKGMRDLRRSMQDPSFSASQTMSSTAITSSSLSSVPAASEINLETK